ncbi:hypothetical protein [Thermohalobacter berrensis]|uniref:ABC transporter Uup C-terminal domain-containing protein n=1 Tax=Thermohalobacter berrensis TaxID=99594 RepID=A0A419T449_9FIRM|nr:hypothetical protein [Thermohalobacter berrensis]RKD32337.1 hypothetical protein BET03_03245 [Thermohalobacter berrensis]
MNNSKDKEYFEQKLEWVKYRIKMLNKIEEKLREMKGLAKYVKDNDLDEEEIQEINTKIDSLREEVVEMDEKSKTFWLDNQ